MRSQSNKLQAYNRSVFSQLSLGREFKIINLDDSFCINGVCLIGDSNHSYYHDSNHISSLGAMLAEGELRKTMKLKIE